MLSLTVSQCTLIAKIFQKDKLAMGRHTVLASTNESTRPACPIGYIIGNLINLVGGHPFISLSLSLRLELIPPRGGVSHNGHPFMTPTKKSGFRPPLPSVHMRPHGPDPLPPLVDVHTRST